MIVVKSIWIRGSMQLCCWFYYISSPAVLVYSSAFDGCAKKHIWLRIGRNEIGKMQEANARTLLNSNDWHVCASVSFLLNVTRLGDGNKLLEFLFLLSSCFLFVLSFYSIGHNETRTAHQTYSVSASTFKYRCSIINNINRQETTDGTSRCFKIKSHSEVCTFCFQILTSVEAFKIPLSLSIRDYFDHFFQTNPM